MTEERDLHRPQRPASAGAGRSLRTTPRAQGAAAELGRAFHSPARGLGACTCGGRQPGAFVPQVVEQVPGERLEELDVSGRHRGAPVAHADGGRAADALDVVGVAEPADQLTGALVVLEHRGIEGEPEERAHSAEHGSRIGDEILVANLEPAIRAEAVAGGARPGHAVLPEEHRVRESVGTEVHPDDRRGDVAAVADDVHEGRASGTSGPGGRSRARVTGSGRPARGLP